MKEKIEQIRDLLSQIEDGVGDKQGQKFSKNCNAFELPSVIFLVVEFLHPELTPYEIAIYWYLFEKSIVKTGKQYARASTRGMRSIAKSASGQSDDLSYGAIKKALYSLKEKEVISVVGGVNRDGTLYKVAFPDEIQICKNTMQKKYAVEVAEIDTNKELDYYNVAENRLKVFERDSYKCHYCSKQLTRFSVTLDHIQPVSKSGDKSYDNLVTACTHCNSERVNRPVMDYIANNS